ncbi:MAG TPA: BlaI/MecI/CopY family transcriptional regulator [Candidatus Limnocylindrales bacterium]|jgi:BlaI family transcriptional regulator, penicillinase repressor|nr:BlaI/MecI/CopY family transcriptional regulator [Candidatus Limnocylindrales bacterium]
MSAEHQLSRRERQIMDVLHAKGTATAAEVLASLPDPPGYSAVRALLRILEEKGHVRHRREGARYVYLSRTSPQSAQRSALKRVVSTFFQGSVAQAMAALLESADTEMSEAELDRLEQLIQKAKKEGR